jgi:hypothetical protein
MRGEVLPHCIHRLLSVSHLIAMIGVWCLSIHRDVMMLNICNGVPGAITVAPAILIVKTNENQNSYDNTIELNFLLKGIFICFLKVWWTLSAFGLSM